MYFLIREMTISLKSKQDEHDEMMYSAVTIYIAIGCVMFFTMEDL